MLTDLFKYIRDLEDISLADKGFLFVLATYANEDGNKIWLSQELLAKKCNNISDRHVRNHLRKMIEQHRLEEVGMHGHVKEYRIPIEKLIPDYAERLAARKLKKTKLVAAPQEQNLRVVPPETQPLSAAPSSSLPPAYQDWRARRPGETATEWARRIDRGR